MNSAPKMSNSLNLTRALALNDAGGTQLFTFLLSMNDLEAFFERPTRSSPIYYEGHEWYLTCGGYQSKDTDDIFLGMYLYWDNKAAGEGVSCRADYRLIVRNVVDASESVVSEGSQVEFSAPDTLGWGKRELAPLHEILAPGNGFLVDPGRTVIVELAVRYCRTIYQQMVDFSQLPEHMNQPFSSYFTPNFSICGFDFYMSFYPLGDREEAERHVSMYLHRLNNPQIPECLCCRIRYRFFLGDRVSPDGDSKSFEFSFKTDRGYGRFRAFDPLSSSDMFGKGPVPIGVEILSITPFAFVEVGLTTRGYYHTDNFVFDDAIFPDHRMNVWKISANNSSQYLSLRLDVEDRGKIYPVTRQGQARDTLCTKYLQWKAYLLSRTDRSHNVFITDTPMSAYFSPAFPEKLFSMSTDISIHRAKALDGDYCTMDEPSLLLRVEFFNAQDIPGIMQDYPVLEFERFRLYQTREGLRRCLEVNTTLKGQLNDLRRRLNEVMAIGDGNIGGNSKQQLMREFQSLLQASDETDSASQAAFKSMTATPGSDNFATSFSFPVSSAFDAPPMGKLSPYLSTSANSMNKDPISMPTKDPNNRMSQYRSGTTLPDFGTVPPSSAATAPAASKTKEKDSKALGAMASLGAAFRNPTKGASGSSSSSSNPFNRGTQARASTASSVRFGTSSASSKPSNGSSILKDAPSRSGLPPGQKSTSSLNRHVSAGNMPASQMRSNEGVRLTSEHTVYAAIAVPPPSNTVPTVSRPASNTYAIVSKPLHNPEPVKEPEVTPEPTRKSKFNSNIFKSVLPKRSHSSANDQDHHQGKSSTLPRSSHSTSSHSTERSTDFFGNKSLPRPTHGIFNQPSSRSTSTLSASYNPAVQKVVPTQSPGSTLTRTGGVANLGNSSYYPPVTTAIVMPVRDVTYTEPEKTRIPPVPAPRQGLMKKHVDEFQTEKQYFDEKASFEIETKETFQYSEPTKPPTPDPEPDPPTPSVEKDLEDKTAFSRASVASVDDPMLQSDVYSIFATAAKEGIKLVDEAPEMDEPLMAPPPEAAAQPKAEPKKAQPPPKAKPRNRVTPEITVTDSQDIGFQQTQQKGGYEPQPLSPSILKKEVNTGASSATVKKSRSFNNVRFNEDVTSTQVEAHGQTQRVVGTSRADEYRPTGSYDENDGRSVSIEQQKGGQFQQQSTAQLQSQQQIRSQQQQFEQQEYKKQLQQQQQLMQKRQLQQQELQQKQRQQQQLLQEEQLQRQRQHLQQYQQQQEGKQHEYQHQSNQQHNQQQFKQKQQQQQQQQQLQQQQQQRKQQQLQQQQQQQQQQLQQYLKQKQQHRDDRHQEPNNRAEQQQEYQHYQLSEEQKQQFRLQQLRREHQEYIKQHDQQVPVQQQQQQVPAQQQQQQQQQSVIQRQLAPKPDPTRQTNLTRSGSGAIQTSL